MTKKLNSTLIQIVHPVCCGLDVHKDKVSACMITVNEAGAEQHEIREFSTFTQDLKKMKEWLIENNCPVTAMESTGVYWHPVYNTIEDSIDVVLVNARQIKNVPGRKTDICDSKWLAGLLRHGLVKGSFIPPENVREWRELSRLRKTYTESLADYKRRVHKLFITANIKIDSVVSDLFGLTGTNLIDLLCSDSELTLEKVKECTKGRRYAQEKICIRVLKKYFCITQKTDSGEETNTYNLTLVDEKGIVFIEMDSFEMVKLNNLDPEDKIIDQVEFAFSEEKEDSTVN